MALEFNTIGIAVKYAVEASAGTKPSSGYTELPDIKSVPEIAMTPNQLEVTNLKDEYRRYIPGVKDVGSNFQFTANLTNDLKQKWASCVSAANTAWASGKSTWFEIAIPNFDSFYFAGVPVELGTNAMNVDSVVEVNLNVTPNKIGGWAAKST